MIHKILGTLHHISSNTINDYQTRACAQKKEEAAHRIFCYSSSGTIVKGRGKSAKPWGAVREHIQGGRQSLEGGRQKGEIQKEMKDRTKSRQRDREKSRGGRGANIPRYKKC